MTNSDDGLAYPPRGMSEKEASRYVGLADLQFKTMVKNGSMPKPKMVDGQPIWDRHHLDAAFTALPLSGDVAGTSSASFDCPDTTLPLEAASVAPLPAVRTPEEVARHFGWSERKLRQEVRRIGACTIFGNRMMLTDHDVASLLETLRPAKPEAAPFPQGDYASLSKLLARKEKEARRAKEVAKLAIRK